MPKFRTECDPDYYTVGHRLWGLLLTLYKYTRINENLEGSAISTTIRTHDPTSFRHCRVGGVGNTP